MSTIGYIPGVWDLLHVGHVQILELAKVLCDRLIVGVPSDFVVEADKGKLPIIPLHDRMRMLAALKPVDVVVSYYKLEFLTHLEAFQPHILVVGETWGEEERHTEAEAWMHNRGGRIVRLPYYRGESTTAIKQRVINQG